MNYESIIFDVDGTIWNTADVQVRAYNAQLRSEKIPLQITKEKLLPLFGSPMDRLAEGLFGEAVRAPASHALMDRCIDRLNLLLGSCTAADVGYPRLRDTMERLSQKHRLFIVSNGPKGYSQQAARTLGLEDLIEGGLSFGDTGTSKGQTLLRLMREHRIESAVYVGDTQGDLDATREAGIDFIWASYGFGTADSYVEKIYDIWQLTEL